MNVGNKKEIELYNAEFWNAFLTGYFNNKETLGAILDNAITRFDLTLDELAEVL